MDALLQENGDYLLQETGDLILLEQQNAQIIWTIALV